MGWMRRAGRRSGTRAGETLEEKLRSKYGRFQELLRLNNECLELLSDLQEELQFVPARRSIVGQSVQSIYERASGMVTALQTMGGQSQETLVRALASQRGEVEAYLAATEELVSRRLAASLSEVGCEHEDEVGGKAAWLGEVRNRLGLPVPNGYVATTEAYRRFCGMPLKESIRSAFREASSQEPERLARASRELIERVGALPVPRAVEVAVEERAAMLGAEGGIGLAVRSSAVGEGGARTFAGQFLSLLNVPPEGVFDAYRQVVASRFTPRAIAYRLSAGLTEVQSAMAVLVLPTLRSRAAGVLYTRDPENPRSDEIWVSATLGLATDLASGKSPADLFVLSRGKAHPIVERRIVAKDRIVRPAAAGGLVLEHLPEAEQRRASLPEEELKVLAHWAARMEAHFRVPLDVEWVWDEAGNLWIVQARPLALAVERRKGRTRGRGTPLLTGGRTVYPGRVSGPAYFVHDPADLRNAPVGAVIFLKRPTPDIVTVLPRISGLVAEGGNVAGHGAALLREFRIPAVFEMAGAMAAAAPGAPVSLSAGEPALYGGLLWPREEKEQPLPEKFREVRKDPVSRRLLALHLVDPGAMNFRARGCVSTHDVMRYCHEKAVETMFEVHDEHVGAKAQSAKRLVSPIPMSLFVLDLGEGLDEGRAAGSTLVPEAILSPPFRAFWRGVSHPGVRWSRSMPASLGGLASVMAGAISSHADRRRALGERSYLLVAKDYMNLNARQAYHFTLVDACMGPVANNNAVAFRFAGGGATWWRRNLRAAFLEACLGHYGFQVDRRGDLVNAWFRKGSEEETGEKLDILGRLMACASQLDMYMTGREAMQWYVDQFLKGNYAFLEEDALPAQR
jgi:pyruvate,water dikinase